MQSGVIWVLDKLVMGASFGQVDRKAQDESAALRSRTR